MRRRFDIDDQRGLICAFGLICLAVELIGFYATGKVPPGELTVLFGTLAAGPWASFTWQKIAENRREEPPEPPESMDDDPPPPPPRRRKSRGLSKCIALATC